MRQTYSSRGRLFNCNQAELLHVDAACGGYDSGLWLPAHYFNITWCKSTARIKLSTWTNCGQSRQVASADMCDICLMAGQCPVSSGQVLLLTYLKEFWFTVGLDSSLSQHQ